MIYKRFCCNKKETMLKVLSRSFIRLNFYFNRCVVHNVEDFLCYRTEYKTIEFEAKEENTYASLDYETP